MAELYQMGDRARDRAMPAQPTKSGQSIVSTRAITLLAAIAAVGAWQLGNLTDSSSKPIDYEPVTANFKICGEDDNRYCVVDGGSFYGETGRLIAMGDIILPNASNPSCANESEAARNGAFRLKTLLNGGMFEMRADVRPLDTQGRQLRILSRDGVSLGALLVRQGVAATPGEPPHWCDQSSTRTSPTG